MQVRKWDTLESTTSNTLLITSSLHEMNGSLEAIPQISSLGTCQKWKDLHLWPEFSEDSVNLPVCFGTSFDSALQEEQSWTTEHAVSLVSISYTGWLQPFSFHYLQHILTVRDVHDVIGGGQLGRMMIEAGNRIGVRIAILDPGILIHCGHHDNIEYLLL